MVEQLDLSQVTDEELLAEINRRQQAKESAEAVRSFIDGTLPLLTRPDSDLNPGSLMKKNALHALVQKLEDPPNGIESVGSRTRRPYLYDFKKLVMAKISQATATSVDLITTERGETILWHRPKGQGVVFMLVESKLSLNLPEDNKIPTNTLTYTFHFDTGDLSCTRTSGRWDCTSSEIPVYLAVQRLIQTANPQLEIKHVTYI